MNPLFESACVDYVTGKFIANSKAGGDSRTHCQGSIAYIENACREFKDGFPIANFASEAQRRWWWAQQGKDNPYSESGRIAEGSKPHPDLPKPWELPKAPPSQFKNEVTSGPPKHNSSPKNGGRIGPTGGGKKGGADDAAKKMAEAQKAIAEQQKKTQQLEQQLAAQKKASEQAAQKAKEEKTAEAQKAAAEQKMKEAAMQAQVDAAKNKTAELSQKVKELQEKVAKGGSGGGGGGGGGAQKELEQIKRDMEKLKEQMAKNGGASGQPGSSTYRPPVPAGNQTPGSPGKLQGIYEDLYGRKMPGSTTGPYVKDLPPDAQEYFRKIQGKTGSITRDGFYGSDGTFTPLPPSLQMPRLMPSGNDGIIVRSQPYPSAGRRIDWMPGDVPRPGKLSPGSIVKMQGREVMWTGQGWAAPPLMIPTQLRR